MAGVTLPRESSRLSLDGAVEVLLNPLGWAASLNALLISQFGITLRDLVVFMVLSFFFWKVLVLFVLPGIYFRVMLYTDEMDSQREPYEELFSSHRRGGGSGWRVLQMLDEAIDAHRFSR